LEKATRTSRGHLVKILKSKHDSDCIYGDFGSATSTVGCSCSCSVVRMVHFCFVFTFDHVYQGLRAGQTNRVMGHLGLGIWYIFSKVSALLSLPYTTPMELTFEKFESVRGICYLGLFYEICRSILCDVVANIWASGAHVIYEIRSS